MICCFSLSALLYLLCCSRGSRCEGRPHLRTLLNVSCCSAAAPDDCHAVLPGSLLGSSPQAVFRPLHHASAYPPHLMCLTCACCCNLAILAMMLVHLSLAHSDVRTAFGVILDYAYTLAHSDVRTAFGVILDSSCNSCFACLG